MNYISLFSGMGGLESRSVHPDLICEIDEAAREVLRRRFPNVPIHPDVNTLEPPTAEVIAGGWPCQDISVAGLRRGLHGERSGLFFAMLRVAEAANAHTIVAENVPNLLSLERGKAFDMVLEALSAAGYVYIAWRTINAREFGLPHERRRIFIVASRYREIAMALHRPYPEFDELALRGEAGFAGFYWTAGLQSICYSEGYVPTLKVGSSLSIPSPPALHFDGVVRKASPREVLQLQGFDPTEFEGIATKHVYRMAGNAVAAQVGRWVFDSLEAPDPGPVTFAGIMITGEHGFFDRGAKVAVEHPDYPLATNLSAIVDVSNREPLSERAAAGLVRRLLRSGKPCPPELMELLVTYARTALEPSERDKASAIIATRSSRLTSAGGPRRPDETTRQPADEEYCELFG